jgi:RNA polymerase sigma factor (sigma-70 family)
MSFGAATALVKIKTASSDTELVERCRSGHEGSWTDLIAKYKNLIYSIPIRTGFTQEEAADIFQAVCLDLFCELSSLREPEALAGWLIRVTRNKCYHKRRENDRYIANDDMQLESSGTQDEIPETLIHEIERDQYLRNALSELSPRCRHLVEKLFFELPARPYREVARELGLAVGSIGIIRRRCLNCLRGRLEELGVR